MKTAKLASARYLDSLPRTGNELGRGFRDVELEQQVLKLTQEFGIGAQFGGKYFCHDVRVIRLPRHGASCPVALAVSCSADRQALGKITADGVFLEQLETDPAQYLPEITDDHLEGEEVVRIDLDAPDGGDPRDALALSGEDAPDAERPDGRRARHRARQAQGAHRRGRGPAAVHEGLLRLLRGPGEDAGGLRVGLVRPDDRRPHGHLRRPVPAQRRQLRDAREGQPLEGRHRRVQESTAASTSGSIGGPAARLAKDCITKVEVLEYAELGMEAVWKIEVVDFPAFIVVDDKGNDFFAEVSKPVALR